MHEINSCSVCGGSAVAHLTEILDYRVGQVYFCADCATKMLARDGTGALLGDAYARLRPLEIQSASALQARDASLRARLANANFRLRMAIEAEAYEEAALWRDEIRRLGGVIAVT